MLQIWIQPFALVKGSTPLNGIPREAPDKSAVNKTAQMCVFFRRPLTHASAVSSQGSIKGIPGGVEYS